MIPNWMRRTGSCGAYVLTSLHKARLYKTRGLGLVDVVFEVSTACSLHGSRESLTVYSPSKQRPTFDQDFQTNTAERSLIYLSDFP
jgi:hypothetical protein